MALKEYVVIKPLEVRDRKNKWLALVVLVTTTFLNTIMPFIVGVYFAQNGNLLLLLFLLFPILFEFRRRK